MAVPTFSVGADWQYHKPVGWAAHTALRSPADAVNAAAGQKLSKQTFATPLDDRLPHPSLKEALRFLGAASA